MPRLYRGLRSHRIVEPQNLWLGLYFGESQRVGFVHLRTTPEEREAEQGYAMAIMARLEFPLFGQETRFHLSGTAWNSAQAGLRDFDFSFISGDHEMRIEGHAHDNVIKAVLTTAGERIPFNLPIDKEVLLSGGMGLSITSMPNLTPGQIAYVDAFDPTTMSVGVAKLEALRYETLMVADTPVETVVVATTIAGITTHAWINEKDEVVRAETPFGLIIKQITPDEALTPRHADTSADMIRTLSITTTGPTPDPDAPCLRLRITGVSKNILPPADTRQKRDNDGIYTLRRQSTANMDGAPLPEAEMDMYLAADLFVQSNHSRIISQAHTIIEDVADDDWKKALRIHDWVYENIAKVHTLSVPSALDVLDVRSGDCNEHAVLFTALARAAGIPTRIVIGLAWSREMQSLGYHAWVEVYVGKWIAMDPTLGESPVGPTHLKLLTGSIDQWPNLLPYIGALDIETMGPCLDPEPDAAIPPVSTRSRRRTFSTLDRVPVSAYSRICST